MSRKRLTPAELIEQGVYLTPNFDANDLTINQLLGLFSHHGIPFPAQYSKPKLVDLFNTQIKPHAKKFSAERIKRENSQASEEGIVNGHTGRPLTEVKKTTRKSTRLSRTPAPQEPEPVAPVAPAKRRRASAQPSLGGPSRRKSTKPAQTILIEESEPEEEPVVRKVGRSKKTDAGTQARSIPIKEDPESGWEDNNVFQSGAESSSPIRPSPVRLRTRSSSRPTLRSRTSMSAPPGIPSPPKDKGKGKVTSRRSSVKPPSSAFEPQLPPSIMTRRQLSVVRDTQEEEEYDDPPPAVHSPPIASFTETLAKAGVEVPDASDHDLDGLEDGSEEPNVENLGDENVAAVAQRIAEGGRIIKREPQTQSSSSSWILRIFIILSLFSSAALVSHYKHESASIGFCDAGKSTNVVLDSLRVRRAAIESCNRENRTVLFTDSTASVPPPQPTATAAIATEDTQVLELCPPPPLLPIPPPDECTPCPVHATCSPSSITCENGYILRPHPLLVALPLPVTYKSNLQSYERPDGAFTGTDVPHILYGVLSLLDGLPGIGPVAAPPRCVEDPRRKRHIGALGRAIDSILANERGRRLCEGVGVGVPEGDAAAEAQKWGIDIEKLREHIKEKTPPNMINNLDDTFNEAVQQLLEWQGVFMGEDATGRRFLAHKTPVMSWQCAARVQARQSWSEWRRSIIGTFLAVFLIAFVRRRQSQKAEEEKRISPLVAVALDSLRNQELAHHTDPVTVAYPYLSSLQLRDLVLQDVHDVAKRKRLWARVERVVEGNANVRTNLQEVEGGDEQRVWEWVGSAGKTLPPGTPGLSRFDFDGRGEGGRIVA